MNGIAAPACQMTLEAWIYPEDDRDQSIAGHGDAAELFIKSGELRFRHMDVTVSASVEPAIGAWQHVVGVWDGVTIRIFVNGVEVGSAEATKRLCSASSFCVGFGERAPWFTGAIDEVAYYDRALEPERIHQHWLTDPPPEVLDPIGGGGSGGSGGGSGGCSGGFGGGGSGGSGAGSGGSGDGGSGDGGDDGEDPVAMAVEVVGKPKLSHHALKVKLACVSDVDCEGTASANLKVGGKRYRLGSKSFEMRSGKTRTVRFGIGRKLRRKMSRARVSATVTIESPSGRVLARARAY